MGKDVEMAVLIGLANNRPGAAVLPNGRMIRQPV